MPRVSLTLTVDQNEDGTVDAMLECPQFVDREKEIPDLLDALEWARRRVEGVPDVFEEYTEE